jgi:sugar phosphate permease
MFPGAVLCTRLTAYNVGLAAVLVLSSTASALTPLAGCDASRALWLRAAMGAAQGPLFPLVSGMFGQWVRSSEYSRANAFVCEGSNLGVLVAYPVTALLCRFRGWQSSFVLPALAAIPCLLMLLVLGSSTPETNRWISASELQLLQADKSSRSSKDGTLVSARSKGFRVKWLALLTNPNVLVLMLNWFTLNWCMWVLLTELPKYLSGALGFDLTASGFIADLPSIANTIGSLVFALLADHLIATGSCSTLATRRIMNGVGAVGTAACLGLVPLMSSTPLIIGLLCASQGFCAATNSGIFSNVFDIAPRSCAVLVGVTNSVGMTQGVISPMITSLVLMRGDMGDMANSFSSSSSSSSADSTEMNRDVWVPVWLIASILAFIGAVAFQLQSTGDLLEHNWLVETVRHEAEEEKVVIGSLIPQSNSIQK